MLTGKQKRFLRAKAHHFRPVAQVGKDGLSENMIKQLVDVLEKRELIKISMLQNCLESKYVIADKIVKATKAELVQIIGNQIILYKQSQEHKTIMLPQ